MPDKHKVKLIIVDYEAGNLFSVEQACKIIGLEPVITSEPQDIHKADALILPGVGAFGDAMKNLREKGLVVPLKEFAASGKAFFGICLGMQLLFARSLEFGEHEGLNIIEGDVKKFPSLNDIGGKIRVPQIGWNRIYPEGKESKWKDTPFESIGQGEFMYFVHSFYANPFNPENILSVSEYDGITYCSAVIKDNIFATQFHPEKSAQEGLKIYKHWADNILRG